MGFHTPPMVVERSKMVTEWPWAWKDFAEAKPETPPPIMPMRFLGTIGSLWLWCDIAMLRC